MKFSVRATVPEQCYALPLKWLTTAPVWVEQWPLLKEKLEVLEQLVQEQSDAGHIEMSTSPWNSLVCVIKKKSGKWRMFTDLRKVNEVIQPMGPLQPGLPSPTMIPQNWSLIIVDLEDCFFTVLPQPDDRTNLLFLYLPTIIWLL